jgi:hypothetical protein
LPNATSFFTRARADLPQYPGARASTTWAAGSVMTSFQQFLKLKSFRDDETSGKNVMGKR